LDRLIEEIRRLMLRSVEETTSERMLNRGGPGRTTGKHQQHQISGAYGQLQGRFWDLGGFQHSWGAHEFFIAVEYDVGESIHLSNAPAR
jgi:hypothetical protein